jgi:hypothetical protein
MTTRAVSHRERASMAILAGIMVLAALVRLRGLGDLPPLGNEYFYLSLHPRGAAQFLEGIRGNPLHLVVTQLLTYGIGRWNDSAGWLRLPSAAFGCAGVWGLWRLAGGKERPRLAAASALLLSISRRGRISPDAS